MDSPLGKLCIAFLAVANILLRAQTLVLSLDSAERTSATLYSNAAILRHHWTVQIPPGSSMVRIEQLPEMVAPLSLGLHWQEPAVRTLTMRLVPPVENAPELLRTYVGRAVSLRRRDGIVEGELVLPPTSLVGGVEPCYVGAVLRTRSGELLVSPCGELVLPPSDVAIARTPVLSAEVSVQNAVKSALELRYQCDGIQWQASYDATLLDDDKLRLEGVVHILNNTHTSFRCSELRLIAGSVNFRTPKSTVFADVATSAMRTVEAQASLAPLEESFDEYHLYTLPFGATLAANSTTVLLLRPRVTLPVKRRLIARGRFYGHTSAADDGSVEVPVSSIVEFVNAPPDSQPLPAGLLRVWRQSAGGSLELVGQDEISHTALGERVAVEVGRAFDVRVRRRDVESRRLSERVTEYTVEYSLQSSRSQRTELSVLETFAGNWEIISSTIPYSKRSAQQAEFTATLPPKGTATFRYTVRQSW
ncbi:MAG: DUF4139 domain-containing protein [Candidatus Kapaibacterium sp.]|nr:MAG: DUF4139 domain-containing protein [Candidatus Kapabacteria bacterium]